MGFRMFLGEPGIGIRLRSFLCVYFILFLWFFFPFILGHQVKSSLVCFGLLIKNSMEGYKYWKNEDNVCDEIYISFWNGSMSLLVVPIQLGCV